MERSMWMAGGAVAVAALAVAGGISIVGIAGASGNDVTAVLRDAGGAKKGTVRFASREGLTEVRVVIDSLPEAIARNAFHGFHIHANADAANGEGCSADANATSNTWFVSADGHWKDTGQNHGAHNGDLPSVFVNTDGSAEARFTISRVDTAQLKGKAVIVHAGADNFGNVPTGAAANQYTPNSADATTATQNTGNAGDRVLCGIVGAR